MSLRQKLLEYKVKKGNMKELLVRMDIIPTSIALAQAAKESGWGTSRFALEGNAMFGQWTWGKKGIAPLDRDKNQAHKILKFPILRSSVQAYKNNLNTHKGYSDDDCSLRLGLELETATTKVPSLSLHHL